MIGAVLAVVLQAIGADAASAANGSGAAPAAAPAHSPNNAADAIADILAQTPAYQAPADQKPPEAGATPPALPATQPGPPTVVAPPPPPEFTPEQRAQMYETGVRSSFQAREARQGPLDGRWLLADGDGKNLYMLQLTDPGAGRGPVEGAWRDLVRQGAVGASGFLTSADRYGQDLVMKFEEGGPCVVTLMLRADGRWTGSLRIADQSRPVVMTRS